MLDISATRASMLAYLNASGCDGSLTIDQIMGEHMVSICDALIAGELYLDSVMASQMIGWGKARNLLIEN